MSAPNLHVALAMALHRPTSDSDAALIDAVYRLRAGKVSTSNPSRTGQPSRDSGETCGPLELGDAA